MRLIRLSKEVFGFDQIEGCIAYFKHVLPWQKGKFNIAGEGAFISENHLKQNEVIIFSYSGNIVAVGKTEKLITNIDGKVTAVKLQEDNIRVFKNPPKLVDIESLLDSIGYTKKIVGVEGWNIIDKQYEKQVLEYLVHHEWNGYDF